MSEALTSELLRAAALDALGPHGDECARDALTAAVIAIELGVTSWESSSGTVRGHRVVLELPASTLAHVNDAPAAGDALHAAVAAAVASFGEREALADLATRWARTRGPSGAPYRDATPLAETDVPAALRDALVEYLVEGGHSSAAALATHALIIFIATGVSVRLVRHDAADGDTLQDALRALVGPDTDVVVTSD